MVTKTQVINYISDVLHQEPLDTSVALMTSLIATRPELVMETYKRVLRLNRKLGTELTERDIDWEN